MSQPGIIFGLNDSGHRPEIFAFDSTGRARGRWIILGARNRDWEAASLGPCGADARPCLYIGDIGDNGADRPSVTVYRVREPASSAMNLVDTLSAERLEVRYPDRPHDSEAMYVGTDGSVYLVTKRRLLNSARLPRPALVYRVPAAGWDSSRATATLVDSLPIVPGSAKGRQVTDAALSPDGRLLAVRTYAEVHVFAVDSTTGRPSSRDVPESCAIVGLGERQGEGIGWWWDRRRLLLTSEGAREPLHVVECPLPVRP